MLAGLSCLRFLGLTLSGKLHLNPKRIGQVLKISQAGSYSVFRDTYCDAEGTKDEVVLVVGFRLKLLRNSLIGHWLFQRVCIFTTPFWSGFRGFRIKLWMVDRESHNYLGIYKWAGRQAAGTYVDALTKVLKPLSVPGTVWYTIYRERFEDFVNQHYQNNS